MTTRVRHTAIVEKVDNGRLTVNIDRSDSACSACAIKSLCSTTKSRSARLDVDDNGRKFNVGDTVTVNIAARTVRYPMLWGIVIPCLLFVGIIAYGDIASIDENKTGLAAFIAVIIYFFIGFLVRFILRKRQVEITLQPQ
ncbi:MAG: SoxR reducing system RseC family protein [Muribaculaceae bacterium]|nr:SoxR reducing system RseC family protein [Muribaculaceae bacterium]